MANAITLRGFNDLGHSVTTIFLSMVHFLYWFSTFYKKMRKNLLSRILNFLPNIPPNSIHLTSSFSCAAVLNAPLRVKVCENDGNNLFEIINTTDSLIQNIIRIVCLCWLIFEFLAEKFWRPCWITYKHPKRREFTASWIK